MKLKGLLSALLCVLMATSLFSAKASVSAARDKNTPGGQAVIVESSSNIYENGQNDSPESADAVSVFSETAGLLSDAHDVDWYKVTIPFSGRFQVTLSHESNAFSSWLLGLYRVNSNGAVALDQEYGKGYYGYSMDYTVSSISSGNDVYYIKVSGNPHTAGCSYHLVVNSNIPAPNAFKAAQTDSAVKLKWSKVPGATGYILYRYSPTGKKYKKLADLDKGTTAYTVANLKAGTAYSYAIQTCYKANGKTYCSDYKRLSTATRPSAPSITSVTAGNKKVSLKWSRSSGATCYQIYMATKQNGTYRYVGTTDSRKYVKTNLVEGQTCYFKVRASKVFDGGKVYSSFSPVVSVDA